MTGLEGALLRPGDEAPANADQPQNLQTAQSRRGKPQNTTELRLQSLPAFGANRKCLNLRWDHEEREMGCRWD